ncbi:Ti-type conjugative transfer relaxase TraA [Phenylobacterium sp. LH3H17]|uniref:Ti-type conjugative transfer relaxase TraA n=1 Tax=Phenylobacterium sp. LH3H17 TaxID=2903901 RepID=UPI0020C9EB93|nr:Ti-type conjugative transfer relaxase TraA [Phenylobacterium sp. LH3H17]UTP40932.1 Ti-type conjugative transfer relaxase TraA [Phenylobacterium sp. LH3H17]
MAIYHFSAKVIGRGRGSSAVAAAAYRSASKLFDERIARSHNFSNKAGVEHSEVLLPEGAPERWADRQTLWNEVEAAENRRDAQLAREVEFAIPKELSQKDGLALARAFVQREFVSKGMVADLNVHWDIGKDGEPKPHAHVMLTLREATPNGFGAKVRDWNRVNALGQWRRDWSRDVNRRLAQLGIEVRVDHRSFKDQGIDLEPQGKIGPAAAAKEGRQEYSARAEQHRQIALRNGERIIAEPTVALNAITRQQATFTDHDLARFVHRHTDGKEQFDRALAAVRSAPEIISLGRDGKGRERFTSREMLSTEQRLAAAADRLSRRTDHRVSALGENLAHFAAARRGLVLSDEQTRAVRHVTGGSDLALVIGYAGTGKSALLGVAREAWEGQGFRVQGAALSGIAAESLEGGSAIPSRTLASYEHAWERGRDQLTSRDVLVIDEAGLVGSRQLERVLGKAEAAGAKVVLVGDPEQLQAIEAGAAFRALSERHGAVELTEVRRQGEGWQRDATRQLATGRTAEALGAYRQAGMVHVHEDLDAARAAVVARWADARGAEPRSSQVMLAYLRADVAELNRMARDRMREAGQLGEDQAVTTMRGARDFAAGDRVMFLRNERSLGVKNGTLGEIVAVSATDMSVRLDDGRAVAFDLKDYADLDYGYASTIHKSQGVTVDRAHVLASGHLDRHAAYVALSRHRARADLHYDRETFAQDRDLVRALSRDRAKDTTLDYGAQAPAPPDAGAEGGVSAPRSGLFAAFRPSPRAPGPEAGSDLGTAAQAYARAWSDAERMRGLGLSVLEHQSVALEQAGRMLEEVRPGLADAVDRSLRGDPKMVDQARRGETHALLRSAEHDRLGAAIQGQIGLKQGPERERALGHELPPPTRGRGLGRGWER